MQHHEPLTYGNCYHIYNRGINSCDLFREEDNYRYFRELYNKHISPMAVTLAWVLMPNHFHFLVRIKGDETLSGFGTPTGLKPPHQYFSNLFNAYTQAYNKVYKRHGALFERPFRRKLIDDEYFLKNVLLYIHNNPVHHSFCDHPADYLWSSYHDYFSDASDGLPRDEVVELFGDFDNFNYVHEEKSIDRNIEL